MRAKSFLKVGIGAAIVTMFGLGVGAAVAPLQAQEEEMLCMFQVSSCATNECMLTCQAFDPATTPICNRSNLCCNCFL